MFTICTEFTAEVRKLESNYTVQINKNQVQHIFSSRANIETFHRVISLRINKPLISTNKECITNTIHIIMSCHCHAHFQSYMCKVEGWWMRMKFSLRVSQQFSTVVRVHGCIYFLQFCCDFLWSIVWDLYLVL